MQINLFESNKSSKRNSRISKGKGIFFIVFGVLGIWAKVFVPGILCILVGIYFVWSDIRVTMTETDLDDDEDKPHSYQSMSRKERLDAYQKEMRRIEDEFSFPDDEDGEE